MQHSARDVVKSVALLGLPGLAPVAQGIEHRPPEAVAQVRILPGAPNERPVFAGLRGFRLTRSPRHRGPRYTLGTHPRDGPQRPIDPRRRPGGRRTGVRTGPGSWSPTCDPTSSAQPSRRRRPRSQGLLPCAAARGDATGQPDSRGGTVECGSTEDGCSQGTPATNSGENKIVRRLVRHVRGELVHHETRDRDLAPLVRFWGAPHLLGPDQRHRFGDDRPSAFEVQPSHAERRQLAEAHTRVGEEEHHEAVLVPLPLVLPAVLTDVGILGCRAGERIDLEMSQVPLLSGAGTRQIHVGCWVPRPSRRARDGLVRPQP
jgi:hypothetical protein